ALALAGLREWRPPPGRGTLERLALPSGEIALFDDAYNANPTSIAAALEVLAAAQPGPGGRRVLILGDMLELGPQEAAIHAELADLPSMGAVDLVHCAGPRMAGLWQALPAAQRGLQCDAAAALADQIGALMQGGDVVLVKGSNGSRVSRVVDALRALGQGEAETARGLH
ncbi:MAG: UDP-N-acetylmuramoyl-tripeptide--D-alanyl-D-alanine ligase, partial [Mangrovicoccus sp.]|nr:UDP-N-acetylmuramoyl-tripeptide--D-alanyl-D-alanine ligase [Mangrovicoccus sp.]